MICCSPNSAASTNATLAALWPLVLTKWDALTTARDAARRKSEPGRPARTPRPKQVYRKLCDSAVTASPCVRVRQRVTIGHRAPELLCQTCAPLVWSPTKR